MIHREFQGWKLLLAVMTAARGALPFPPLRAAEFARFVLLALDFYRFNVREEWVHVAKRKCRAMDSLMNVFPAQVGICVSTG